MAKSSIIDFEAYGLDLKDETTVSETVLKPLGNQLKEVLSADGYCYLKNHGIKDKLIAEFRQAYFQFYELPDEEKTRYIGPNLLSGYVPFRTQSLNRERPADVRESFGYCPSDMASELWPPLPDLKTATLNLYGECKILCHRICDVLSLGLGKPLPFLRETHKLIGQEGNPTTIRSLYYPSVLPDNVIKSGQIRCGEHSDFGTFTILFQDDIEGLEALVSETGYIPVTHVSETLLIFVGDLLQRWTSDGLPAVKHRVVIPEKETGETRQRHTIAFFVHPDAGVIIKCLDGSDTYEPISSIDYVNYRLNRTVPGNTEKLKY